ATAQSLPAYTCPQPCPASTAPPGGAAAEPVPPTGSCPPPCPGAKACPPPCGPGSAGGGPGAGAFAPCPSGVEGRVTAGPTCPVQRADEPCPDKPVETTLRLVRQDGTVAGTGKSGPDGAFRIAAAPGNY